MLWNNEWKIDKLTKERKCLVKLDFEAFCGLFKVSDQKWWIYCRNAKLTPEPNAWKIWQRTIYGVYAYMPLCLLYYCQRTYVTYLCVSVCHFIHRQMCVIFVVCFFRWVSCDFASPSLSFSVARCRSVQFSWVLSIHFYWACQLYVNHRQRRIDTIKATE